MICAQKIKTLKCQIKPLEFSPNIQYFSHYAHQKLYQAVKQGWTDVWVDRLDTIIRIAEQEGVRHGDQIFV